MKKKIEEFESRSIYLCPVCQFDCTHITQIDISHSSEHTNFILRGECENGHRFQETVFQHKGNTVIDSIYLGPTYVE